MSQSNSKSFDNSSKASIYTHQLAKDALEIRKILGLVMIDKEDAAIKRINCSLKKERKTGAQRRAVA